MILILLFAACLLSATVEVEAWASGAYPHQIMKIFYNKWYMGNNKCRRYEIETSFREEQCEDAYGNGGTEMSYTLGIPHGKEHNSEARKEAYNLAYENPYFNYSLNKLQNKPTYFKCLDTHYGSVNLRGSYSDGGAALKYYGGRFRPPTKEERDQFPNQPSEGEREVYFRFFIWFYPGEKKKLLVAPRLCREKCDVKRLPGSLKPVVEELGFEVLAYMDSWPKDLRRGVPVTRNFGKFLPFRKVETSIESDNLYYFSAVQCKKGVWIDRYTFRESPIVPIACVADAARKSWTFEDFIITALGVKTSKEFLDGKDDPRFKDVSIYTSSWQTFGRTCSKPHMPQDESKHWSSEAHSFRWRDVRTEQGDSISFICVGQPWPCFVSKGCDSSLVHPASSHYDSEPPVKKTCYSVCDQNKLKELNEGRGGFNVSVDTSTIRLLGAVNVTVQCLAGFVSIGGKRHNKYNASCKLGVGKSEWAELKYRCIKKCPDKELYTSILKNQVAFSDKSYDMKGNSYVIEATCSRDRKYPFSHRNLIERIEVKCTKGSWTEGIDNLKCKFGCEVTDLDGLPNNVRESLKVAKGGGGSNATGPAYVKEGLAEIECPRHGGVQYVDSRWTSNAEVRCSTDKPILNAIDLIADCKPSCDAAEISNGGFKNKTSFFRLGGPYKYTCNVGFYNPLTGGKEGQVHCKQLQQQEMDQAYGFDPKPVCTAYCQTSALQWSEADRAAANEDVTKKKVGEDYTPPCIKGYQSEPASVRCKAGASDAVSVWSDNIKCYKSTCDTADLKIDPNAMELPPNGAVSVDHPVVFHCKQHYIVDEPDSIFAWCKKKPRSHAKFELSGRHCMPDRMCRQPKDPENGWFANADRYRYLAGSLLVVQCADGYTPEQPNYIICQYSPSGHIPAAQWDIETPKCRRADVTDRLIKSAIVIVMCVFSITVAVVSTIVFRPQVITRFATDEQLKGIKGRDGRSERSTKRWTIRSGRSSKSGSSRASESDYSRRRPKSRSPHRRSKSGAKAKK